ncbi:MAG TPA: ABC transporter permease [Flavobacteriales bacterium]|nr:ABC transporter permease [Flavobacteriales bacterium]HMU13459.1 ABC transporter permease [Flavobacteriales bacterium]HNE81098.1 ABC transporter permease [Flavobacteriales bacterium]HNI05471.1 ABC transporter permease [Flavobacteriales bacterium]HNK39750.1 ABC transporter permease [Flavobacteriales bacterium]
MNGPGTSAWDVTIKPQQAWWRPDLKEFWHYRDLLMLLVRRDLTAQYKQTILGPAWLVAQPLLTTITYTVMFGLVARLAPAGIPAMLFYLSGIVPWTCFSGVVNKTSRTFVTNSAVLTKVYFPRLIMPVSTTLSTLFSFLVQLGLLFLIIAIYALFMGFQWSPSPLLVLLPVVILVMSLLGLGAGILISAMTTKYRDLGFLVAFGVQLLMFASPVIFPMEIVAKNATMLAVLQLNPMTGVIVAFRTLLFGGVVDWGGLGYSAAFAVGLVLVGLALFQRVERSFADVV